MPKQYPFYYIVYSVLRLLGSLAAGVRKILWLSFLIWISYLYMLGSSEGLAFEAVLQVNLSFDSLLPYPAFLASAHLPDQVWTLRCQAPALSPEAKFLNQWEKEQIL